VDRLGALAGTLELESLISVSANVTGGTPSFVGMRVSVKNLVDSLAARVVGVER